MATVPSADDAAAVEEFLTRRGHEVPERWDRDAMKKQCPECRGLHDLSATRCSVCGWEPTA